MKNTVTLLFFSLVTGIAQAGDKITMSSHEIGFTPNRGQVKDQAGQNRPDVLFGGQAGKLAFHLRTNGISYQLSKIDRREKNRKDYFNKKRPAKIEKISIQRLDINWLGANTQAQVLSENQYPGYSNFYSEANKEGITMVPSFSSVRYKELYPSI